MPPSEPKPCRQVISRQLRAMIEGRGLSARALGREAGVDSAVITRFLKDERGLTLDTLDRLADVLGLRLIEGAPSKRTTSRAGRGAVIPRSSRAKPKAVEVLDDQGDEVMS